MGVRLKGGIGSKGHFELRWYWVLLSLYMWLIYCHYMISILLEWLVLQCSTILFSLQTQVEVIDKILIESESEVHNHLNTGTWTQQQVAHANLQLHTHHDDSGHSSGGEGGGEGPGSGVGGGSSSPPVVHDGKNSLLQFALQHFRQVLLHKN